ncbi:MAG: PilZ domain-containing protein [Deltaproteobacteria bacterium]|nr:PilZ domain-containing protein [Deltaproteobacteria bacterium]MBW1924508.1 PilZ domain-containing protein [Deltaproteobacteria bacterium]MBW1949668.1 PilZ domain-containing protein [Deltaproteobacteria bacterium]MBW2008109.1 PilZ domain-containing protein [Deltaproteobacteria bacterium]MBW2102782.1 PilZ domain-containing protein [Deltaproteobacteria bacterium]
MAAQRNQDTERRRYPRVRTLRLLSYVNREDDEQKTGVSMARTLDVSPAGVRVEVHEPVSPGSLMEMEIAVEEEILSVTGKVVHSEQDADGLYVVGIQFEEKQDRLS